MFRLERPHWKQCGFHYSKKECDIGTLIDDGQVCKRLDDMALR